ncbi:hypothetical protein A5782_04370 [Mycobacterium sp. 852002-40037_SCH5390672]|nr:hypothetical protein A5782_04370 [Mycobacterium sp. 852002-40037_SCH5390672]
MRILFAGAAAIAMLMLFDAARADATQTGQSSGPVRLLDQAADLPLPANGPFGPQFPQTPPDVIGNGGFSADDGDDEAQLQEQLAQQEMQQAQQQAEQQNEQAQQQAQQAEQQGQWVEQNPGP